MKVAAHIKEARKNGTQAGFDAWYDNLNTVTNGGTNGLPQVQELLAEVNRAGKLRKRTGEFAKPEKALQFYCNKYGLTDLPATRLSSVAKAKRQARATTGTTRTVAPAAPAQDDLIEQFKAFIESKGMTPVDTEEDDDEDEDDVEIPARSERRNVRNVRRQSATAAPATQEFPPPRDPDAPATQGKLWKLNAEGPDNGLFMCVIDEDGNILAGGDSPLTAGECYDLIGEHIA